jgi:hypothetical protein
VITAIFAVDGSNRLRFLAAERDACDDLQKSTEENQTRASLEYIDLLSLL